MTHDPTVGALVPAGGDLGAWTQGLCATLGTENPGWALLTTDQVFKAVGPASAASAGVANGLLAALAECAPGNPLEAGLLSQALLTHLHATRMLAKAAGTTHPDAAEKWLRLANKLMGLYRAQVETWGKLRAHQQHLEVRHVHVQAVVGDVHVNHNREVR